MNFTVAGNSTNVTIGGGTAAGAAGGMFIVNPSDMMLRRERALALTPHISGSLSMLGSLLVAAKIINTIRKKGTVQSYNYIILAMTAVDFVASLAYSFSTRAMPPGPAPWYSLTSRYGANGTEGTCAAQGFFIQFGLCIVFLNLLLSGHYLAVIRYNVAERRLKKLVAPGIFVALFVGLALSIPGVVMEAYGPSPIWCWIGPDLKKCLDEGIMQQECKERAYRWRDAMYFIPLWITLGLITFFQIGIVWTVWQIRRKTNKWRFQSQTASRTPEASQTESDQTLPARTRTFSSLSPAGQRLSRKQKRRERRAKKRLNSTQRVAIQSILYLSSFYIAWLPLTIVAHVLPERSSDVLLSNAFLLLWSVTLLQPLQGFLNCIVYFQFSIAKKIRDTFQLCLQCCQRSSRMLAPQTKSDLEAGYCIRPDSKLSSKVSNIDGVIDEPSDDEINTLPTDMYKE